MRWCAWFFYRAEKSATSLDKNKVTPLLSALAELNQIRIGCQRITAIGEFTIIRNILKYKAIPHAGPIPGSHVPKAGKKLM